MTLSRSNPRVKQRWALLLVALVAVMLAFAALAQGFSQTEFELDKNATNDLTTTHLGVTKSAVKVTATSIIICEITGVPNPDAGSTILIDGEQMTVASYGDTSTQTGGCSFNDPALVASGTRVYNVTRASPVAHPGDSDVTLMVTGAADGDDWDQVHTSVQTDLAATPPITEHKCTDLGATACLWVADGFGESVFTTGGSKDDLNINPLAGEAGTGWKWTDSSVPPSDEILHAFAIKYSGTDQLLFFGADRYATNGAKDMGFWLFHDTVGLNTDGTFSGNHTRPTAGPDTIPGNLDDTRGDILLLSTFTQGGAVTSIRVFEWVGVGGDTNGTLQDLGAFGDCAAGSLTEAGCNTVNNTTVPSPWSYQGSGSTNVANMLYSGALTEGGINLTALGLEGCFSSFMAETRSAPEPGAQLKDFALGNFESCSTDLTTTPSDGSGVALVDGSDADTLPEIQIGTGDAGVDVRDSAVLDVKGSTSFTGEIDFYLCGPIEPGVDPVVDPGLCDTGGVFISTLAANANGTYLSAPDSANLTSVGRYCWRAEFVVLTGDVPTDTDSSVGECFEVTPVTPTLTTTAVAASVGLSPTIVGGLADLNGDGVVNGDDDSNAFYGDTSIIDGALDCDDWATQAVPENAGTAGDGTIDGDDDCTLIGYDGTADGVEIGVVNGAFATADGDPIADGTSLPTVFNALDPDNADVGLSDFAWSTIFGRVDSNGDEAIDGEDCHFGIIGSADILGSDPGCGFAVTPSPALDGLVDLNGDGNITAADDSCSDGCFFGHDVFNGLVAAGTVDFGDSVYDVAILTGTANQPGTDGPGDVNGAYLSINAPTTAAANGTITFTLVGPGDCTTEATSQDVIVSGDGYYVTLAFTPDAPGNYSWKASYSGDPDGDPDPPLNTLGATHNAACGEAGEDVTVQQIPTAISTEQKWFPQDSATITSSEPSDNLEPGGTVEFRLFGPTDGEVPKTALENCQVDDGTALASGLLYTESKTLNGLANSETVSTNNTTVAVDSSGETSPIGPFYWRVTYTLATGDTAHTGRVSDCAESFSITFSNDSGPGDVFP